MDRQQMLDMLIEKLKDGLSREKASTETSIVKWKDNLKAVANLDWHATLSWNCALCELFSETSNKCNSCEEEEDCDDCEYQCLGCPYFDAYGKCVDGTWQELNTLFFSCWNDNLATKLIKKIIEELESVNRSLD